MNTEGKKLVLTDPSDQLARDRDPRLATLAGTAEAKQLPVRTQDELVGHHALWIVKPCLLFPQKIPISPQDTHLCHSRTLPNRSERTTASVPLSRVTNQNF